MIKQVRSNNNKLILENENLKRETYVSAPKIRQLQNQLETSKRIHDEKLLVIKTNYKLLAQSNKHIELLETTRNIVRPLISPKVYLILNN